MDGARNGEVDHAGLGSVILEARKPYHKIYSSPYSSLVMLGLSSGSSILD